MKVLKVLFVVSAISSSAFAGSLQTEYNLRSVQALAELSQSQDVIRRDAIKFHDDEIARFQSFEKNGPKNLETEALKISRLEDRTPVSSEFVLEHVSALDSSSRPGLYGTAFVKLKDGKVCRHFASAEFGVVESKYSVLGSDDCI